MRKQQQKRKVERKGRTNKVVPIVNTLFVRKRNSQHFWPWRLTVLLRQKENLKGQGIIRGGSEKDVWTLLLERRSKHCWKRLSGSQSLNWEGDEV